MSSIFDRSGVVLGEFGSCLGGATFQSNPHKPPQPPTTSGLHPKFSTEAKAVLSIGSKREKKKGAVVLERLSIEVSNPVEVSDRSTDSKEKRHAPSILYTHRVATNPLFPRNCTVTHQKTSRLDRPCETEGA
jgi:hypothetical protein